MFSAIIGLGNPGQQYYATRHNVGFILIDRLCERLGAIVSAETELYHEAKAERDGRLLVLAKPRTYMNRSGLAAKALLQQINGSPKELLVLVDDLNLPLGTLRFRMAGSDGGHNGLANLADELESENFPRLRLGIGPVADKISRRDFVLGEFEAEEAERLSQMIATATEAVLYAIDHRLEWAMSKYNKTPAQPDNE